MSKAGKRDDAKNCDFTPESGTVDTYATDNTKLLFTNLRLRSVMLPLRIITQGGMNIIWYNTWEDSWMNWMVHL